MDFSECMKKVFLAGVGAAATAVESASDIVNKLVEKGEITFEQGKVLNEELKRDAKQKAKKHLFDALEKLSPEDREELKNKLDEIEKAESKNKETQADSE
ncbi:MAG: aspartyl beta-hydroxylase [Clostridia bacterium]